jgi:sec-independent protein translocase protein TatA
MAGLGTTEIIIIALVIVLLFGAKKLPDAARGLGKSLRIFKAETKALRDDDTDDDAPAKVQQPPAALPHGQTTAQQGPQVAPPLEHDVKRDSA